MAKKQKVKGLNISIESYTTFEFELAKIKKGGYYIPISELTEQEYERITYYNEGFFKELKRQMTFDEAEDPALAIQKLFYIPQFFEDKATVAKILLMILLTQIADSTEDDDTWIIKMPVLYLEDEKKQAGHAICENMEKILYIVQGPPVWSNDGETFRKKTKTYDLRWILRRPWYIRAERDNGGVKQDIGDYVGGEYGGRKFWCPYINDAVLLDNGLPDSVSRKIIEISSQAMPILMKKPRWRLDRDIIQLNGESFSHYQPGTPARLRDWIQEGEIFWTVNEFLKWFYKKKKRYNRWKERIEAFKPKSRSETGYIVDQMDPVTALCCQGLSLMEQMLQYAVKHLDLNSEIAETLLDQYQNLVFSTDEAVENTEKMEKKQPVQREKKYSDKECFEAFLVDFVEQNIQQIQKAKKGTEDTLGIVLSVDREADDSLVVPRDSMMKAYQKWLKNNGLEVPNQKDSIIQKELQNQGVQLRNEKESDPNSWRFQFYSKNHAPKGKKEKLPCIGIHLNDLPKRVRELLEELPE